MVGQPPRGLEPRICCSRRELGWHRASQPWQTNWSASSPGGTRCSTSASPTSATTPASSRRSSRSTRRDPGRARRRPCRRRGRRARSSRTWRCSAAMVGLYVLARDRLSEDHARRSVLYLVLSPYAFALAMAYSEGPFLAFIVWLFVLSDRRARPGGRAARVRRRAHARDRPRPRRAARAAGVAAADGLGVGAGGRAAGRVRRPGRLAPARRRRPARDGARAGASGAGIPPSR